MLNVEGFDNNADNSSIRKTEFVLSPMVRHTSTNSDNMHLREQAMISPRSRNINITSPRRDDIGGDIEDLNTNRGLLSHN